jgi:flagellar basal body-associated protein FliL
MHEAIVTAVKVTPHPDPEVHSLAVGYVLGETIVVSKDTKDGELGLYFPCDLQLSEGFATANDLVRRKNPDGTNAGGMFDANRKVRAQKLRGVKSNGFWCPLSYLAYAGDVSSLKEGDKIATFNGKEICKKYFTPAYYKAIGNKSKQQKKNKIVCIFPEHRDTEQFKHNLKSFNKGDRVVITLKMEGTSQRVAKNLEFREPKWWEKIIQKFTKLDLSRMVNLNGTRRVTLNYKDPSAPGYYSDSFRQQVADRIVPYLDEYMEVFCEVVGWTGDSTIMPKHSLDKIKDKEIRSKYKDPIVFSYDCLPGEFQVYIYRIAYVLPNGKTVDMPWNDVKKWCNAHKLKHVPEIASFIFDGNKEELLAMVESLSDGPDILNPSHPKEGVCVRIDGSHWECYKNKGWTYKVLANIIKDNDNYVDGEECS